MDRHGVTFRWKDYRARSAGKTWPKTMTLRAHEFILDRGDCLAVRRDKVSQHLSEVNCPKVVDVLRRIIE